MTDNPAKIPVVLGFANLSGDDLAPLVDEDAAILSPLFEAVRRVDHHLIPVANVLFVYAHLHDDGTMQGLNNSSIRQIVERTKASLVVLASPNPQASIMAVNGLSGPRTANLVFTLDRNADGFGRFFRALFEKMRDGKEFLAAWIEIAPQARQPVWVPGTILAAEAGRMAFPPAKMG